jgi:hypothetical protein
VYLAWHPTGRHVDEAVEAVAVSLGVPGQRADALGTMRCADLRASVAAIRSAVEHSAARDKTAALEAIGRYEALCPPAVASGVNADPTRPGEPA